MKKEITLEERKKIQLEMLIEIDAFCRAHNIKYMLAFGTLLGAIRHKGYIPWDDDVDISMPLDDMLRFKKEFKSEKLKYCDVDTESYYDQSFPRISDKRTYNKQGLVCKSFGVCIDLYPLFEVSSSSAYNTEALKKLYPEFKKYRLLVHGGRKILKLLPISTIPGFNKAIRRYRNMEFQTLSYKDGGAFHCNAGPIDKFDLHTFDFNPFDEMIEVDFEGYKFMAPAKYHEYLTRRYGDYMQLPPEDQRHPYHGGKYFWK